MQVVCVEAFGGAEPGDVAEVPDGAAVDPRHWRVVPPTVTVNAATAEAAIATAKASLGGLAAQVLTPKEGM